MATSTAQRAMTGEDTTAHDPSQGPLGSVGWAVLQTEAVGPLWLAWVGAGLTVVRFGDAPLPEEELRRAIPELDVVPSAPVPSLVEDTLRRYFAGEPVDPGTLPVRLWGTRFHRRVWEALRAVPRGSVRTYAGLAADARSPRATRAVGTAMARNPLAIVVPCHRVVASGAGIGGYSGGLDRKRALLALEDVRVEGDRLLFGQLDLIAPA
jgi:O-6-methylguanine DNA methyltransferase